VSKLQYPLPAFDGGLNNKYEPYTIADNESPECLNTYAEDLGGAVTRDGSTKLNTAAVGSFANHGLFTCRRDNGNQTMVGWWNGGMYTLNTTTFVTVPSAQSVYTAGGYVCQVMYQDLAFYGNGYSTNYKWNGTEFTRMGIEVPSVGSAVANSFLGIDYTSIVGNVPAGELQYKVSYVNSYVVEGDVSNPTPTFTIGASGTVSINCLPVAPTSFGVAARKIYRRDSTTAGDFKYVATVSNNTATAYSDNIAATSLGPVAPVDQGIPPKFNMAVVHKERIFLKSPDDPLIYYTELGNPFVVKVLNFQKVGDGDGEICNGLGVHADSVAVYKKTAPWLIYMQDADPDNWSVIKTNAKYGSSGHFSIVDYEQYQMYLGSNFEGGVNFAALKGGALSPSLTDLNVATVVADSKSDKIEPDVRLFNQSLLNKVFGIRFKNKLFFAVPYGTSATSNTRVYVFDYFQRDKDRSQGAWWPMTYPWSVAYMTIYNGNLYASISDATGFVYRIEVPDTYSDDGTAIDSYMWTKEFEGHPEVIENHKDFRRLNLTMGTLGAWNVGVSYRLDADPGDGNLKLVDINPGGGLWGSMIWGSGTWGGGSVRKQFKIDLGTASGLKIQFKFDNRGTVGRAFKVLRGMLFYSRRGRR
jgi:hypothetical protein